MPHLNVTLETVTPLFLGGATPRGEPELRPASLKGELRYWWRALYGGSQPGVAPEALAKNEDAVFGSTEGASPIVLRISHEPQKKAAWSFGQWEGIDYLFFSVRGRGSDPDRKAFSPQQSFQLTLHPRLGLRAGEQDKGEQAFIQACAALWLAVRLGGVGARSRRGAGNLRVTDVKGWPDALPSPMIQATSGAGLNQEFARDLRRLYQALGWPAPPPALPARPEFDILHPKGGPLYVLGAEWNTWQAALDAVGLAYRDFRSRRQPDYGNVKAVVSGASSQLRPVERAAFGLPIVFYYRSLGGQRGTLEGQGVDRRTSPLVFHVSPLSNGKYTINLTRFNARLLPPGSGLRLKSRGQPAQGNPPDGKVITQFLQAIGQPGHQDVHGDLFIAPLYVTEYPT